MSEEECFSQLDSLFDFYSLNVSSRTNNNTKYYSFYLPSDIQELEFDDTYHHFIFNSSDFIMNLNINAIVCNHLSLGQPDDPFDFLRNNVIYTKDISMLDNNIYRFCLYSINDKYYFSYYTDKYTFFGETKLGDVTALASHLIDINASAKIDYNTIIDTYYRGTTIEYSQEKLDLFDADMPVPIQGLLEDISENAKKTEIIETEENEEITTEEQE